MKPSIGPFKLYTKKPNSIRHGFLYTLEMEIPVRYEKKRTIRVFVPEDYSEDKKYPVMYMSDGQNIVDKYTTAYGDWNIGQRQYELRKEGYPPFIVVGIDCPKNAMYRTLEYSFPLRPLKSILDKSPKFKKETQYPDQLYKFIVNTLKPLIDENFSTLKEKEFTACGGSSMGGTFSFGLISSYPDIFGFCLSFSPAYFLYYKKEVFEMVDERMKNMDKTNRFYLYTGTEGFEKRFLKRTIDMNKYLVSHNIPCELSIDKKGLHHEKTWSKYFTKAIRFWFNKN